MLQMTAGFINRIFIFKSKIYVFGKVWDQTNKHCHYKKRNMNLHFLGLSSFVIGLIDLYTPALLHCHVVSSFVHFCHSVNIESNDSMNILQHADASIMT